MHLFFSELGGYADPLDPARVVDAASARKIGVIEGMPFVLSGDGHYDERLNRFFRALPGHLGVRSPHSWRAYAQDLVVFARFLAAQEPPRTVWQATAADTEAYYLARRVVDDGAKLSASSWNRTLAALECFYGWAVSEGHVAAVPFRYGARRRWRRDGAERGAGEQAGGDGHAPPGARNGLRDGTRRERDIVHVTAAEYRFFRDVGLRGLLPDGRPDPDHQKRTGDRDAAMADLLFLTGMRIEEASTLLADELPTRAALAAIPAGENYTLDLAPECCKGNKGRKAYLPKRLVADLLAYAEVDRGAALAKAGVRAPASRAVVVTRCDDGPAYRVVGGRRRLHVAFGPRERRRLVVRLPDGHREPGWLFLTEKGTPFATTSWDDVFAAARARCRAFGRHIPVTPHVLRHTYAVHMLSRLIHRSADAAAAAQARAPGDQLYQALMGDAMQLLRTYLGHVSVETTHLYLRCLRESRRIADMAAMDLADMVYGGTYADDMGEP